MSYILCWERSLNRAYKIKKIAERLPEAGLYLGQLVSFRLLLLHASYAQLHYKIRITWRLHSSNYLCIGGTRFLKLVKTACSLYKSIIRKIHFIYKDTNYESTFFDSSHCSSIREVVLVVYDYLHLLCREHKKKRNNQPFFMLEYSVSLSVSCLDMTFYRIRCFLFCLD